MDSKSENSSSSGSSRSGSSSTEDELSRSFGDYFTSTSSSAEEVTPWQDVDDDIVITIEDSSSEESQPKKKRKRDDGTPKLVKPPKKVVKKKAPLQRQNAIVVESEEPSWPAAIATTTAQARARNFVFTWNNYKAIDVTNIKKFAKSMLEENPKFYLCIGFEVGGEKKIPHLQGCCLMGKQVAWAALHKAPYPFKSAACLLMKGTPKQASDYCKKDGVFWECGTCPASTSGGKSGRQGQRNDIIAVVDKIKSGATDKMLLDEHPAETFKFLRNIRQVQSLIKPVRSLPLQVILCYGTPGAGKTHWVDVKFPDHFRMPVSKDFWMDNYQQEKTVLLDDFNGETKLTFLLQVLDKYPIQIPIKGGFVWWCPDTIVLTCNTHPCNWYDYSTRQDSYAALKRRFTKILKFKPVVYDDEGLGLHSAPTETSAHNFFMYQKVIGKHCLDVSENKPDDPLAVAALPMAIDGDESTDLDELV